MKQQVSSRNCIRDSSRLPLQSCSANNIISSTSEDALALRGKGQQTYNGVRARSSRRATGVGLGGRTPSCQCPEKEPSKTEIEETVRKMHTEFASRRKAQLTGLPVNCTEEV